MRSGRPRFLGADILTCSVIWCNAAFLSWSLQDGGSAVHGNGMHRLEDSPTKPQLMRRAWWNPRNSHIIANSCSKWVDADAQGPQKTCFDGRQAQRKGSDLKPEPIREFLQFIPSMALRTAMFLNARGSILTRMRTPVPEGDTWLSEHFLVFSSHQVDTCQTFPLTFQMVVIYVDTLYLLSFQIVAHQNHGSSTVGAWF